MKMTMQSKAANPEVQELRQKAEMRDYAHSDALTAKESQIQAN